MIFSLLILSIAFTVYCTIGYAYHPDTKINLKVPIIPVVVDLIEYDYVQDPEDVDPPTIVMPRKQK